MFKAHSSSARRLRVAAGLGAAAASLAFTGIASAAVTVVTPDRGIGVSCPGSASSSNLTTAILAANANSSSTNTLVLTPGTYCPVDPNGQSTITISKSLSIVADHSYQATGPHPNVAVQGVDFTGTTDYTIPSGVNVTLEGFDIIGSGGSGGSVVSDGGNLTTWGMTFGGNLSQVLSVSRNAVASLNDTTIVDSLSNGILNNGATTLVNDSIVNNTGIGVTFGSYGTVKAYNTLIANGQTGECTGGKFANNPAPGSMDDDGSCGVQDSDNQDVDNYLGALNSPTSNTGIQNNNGGPTTTVAIAQNPDTSLAGTSAYCPLTDGRFFPNPIVSGKLACDIGAVTDEADDTTGAPDAGSAVQETAAPTCQVTGGTLGSSQQVTLADPLSGIGPEIGLATDNPSNTLYTTYSKTGSPVIVPGYAVDNLQITNGSVSFTSPSAPQASLVLTAGNKTTPGVNNSQWSFTGLNWAGVASYCA